MRDHKTIVPHKAETPPVAHSRPGFFSRAGKTLRHVTTLSLATVGVATVAGFAYDYWLMRDVEKKVGNRKKVLVLPFHRMKLVETGSISALSERSDDTIEVSWLRNQICIRPYAVTYAHVPLTPTNTRRRLKSASL